MDELSRRTAAYLAAVDEIAYRIRRSARARRVRVSVDVRDGVEVVLPPRAGRHDAAQAMAELRPWVERRLRALAQAARELGRSDRAVPYLGEQLELVVQTGRTRVARRGDRLLVPAADHGAALERWYRRRARAEVEPRLERAVRRAGTRYTSLQIRGQRTRWASCSANGAMSFNWRLLLAPAEVLDYVVEHEVVHLDVLDHSERFWATLAARCPDWRRHEGWLRRHGHALRL